MTQLQKHEIKLNRLYDKIKSLSLNEDERNFINIRGFLYSVGRTNILQAVAMLTKIALDHNIKLEEIEEQLKD